MFSYINSINFWFNGKSKVKSLPNLEVSPNASNSGGKYHLQPGSIRPYST